MDRGLAEHSAFRGGCQCGAVRYGVTAGTAKDCACHCRMCQRATGNAFAPLVEVKAYRATWDGTPAVWASSSVAWRGFCPTCRTPLDFRSDDTIEFMAGEFMAGTLVTGIPVNTVYNASVESRVDWLDALTHAPSKITDPAILAVVRSFQAPEV